MGGGGIYIGALDQFKISFRVMLAHLVDNFLYPDHCHPDLCVSLKAEYVLQMPLLSTLAMASAKASCLSCASSAGMAIDKSQGIDDFFLLLRNFCALKEAKMKSILFFLIMTFALPVYAAEKSVENTPADAGKSEPAPSANATSPAAPGEYTNKYYTVKLAQGWKAIVPPEEQLGNVNAIFATDTGSSVVTMVAGPSSGEDAHTIAKMFAEQFKARKQPQLENGLYTFQFPIQNTMATAYVASYDGNFMMTYIAGNIRSGQKFIRECISSQSWPGLLPK